MKKLYLYLLDTMADWDHGYLLQALSMQNQLPETKYRICTAAGTLKPVKTAGGLTIVPEVTLDWIDETDGAALLLTGADTWLEPGRQEILPIAERFLSRGLPVAAISGATLGLASYGLLNNRPHTSGAPCFLGLAPEYQGAAFYREAPAVSGGGLITAGPAGALLWARYLLDALGAYPAAFLDAWQRYFETGGPNDFKSMMEALRDAADS